MAFSGHLMRKLLPCCRSQLSSGMRRVDPPRYAPPSPKIKNTKRPPSPADHGANVVPLQQQQANLLAYKLTQQHVGRRRLDENECSPAQHRGERRRDTGVSHTSSTKLTYLTSQHVAVGQRTAHPLQPLQTEADTTPRFRDNILRFNGQTQRSPIPDVNDGVTKLCRTSTNLMNGTCRSVSPTQNGTATDEAVKRDPSPLSCCRYVPTASPGTGRTIPFMNQRSADYVECRPSKFKKPLVTSLNKLPRKQTRCTSL